VFTATAGREQKSGDGNRGERRQCKRKAVIVRSIPFIPATDYQRRTCPAS
jgi:hypothetical protein